MVVDALVSITDLEKTVPLNRQKRSTINAIIRFTAVCSLGFGENSDIEPSIRSSITRAEPRLYDFFDEQSFSSFNLEFEHEPKIVTIEEEIKSENEITDVIGKLSKLWISLLFKSHLRMMKPGKAPWKKIKCEYSNIFQEKIEAKYTRPNETELQEIYTKIDEDKSKCQNLNQWTTWNSVSDPAENNGSDYETIHNHILYSLFP